MRYVLTAMLLLGLTTVAVAENDGDHEVRPRPEYDPLQQEILLAPHNPADPSMRLPYRTVTTDYGRKGFVNLTEGPSVPEVVFAP